MPSPEARFAVLMFTDIVDSTGFKSAHGVPEYMTAFERHNAFFGSIARGFPAMRILQHTGDGFFASFAGVADAVCFALLFQDAMRRGKWAGCALSARVGIHAGEVAATDVLGNSNVLGPAADLTARVMSLATSGQILLTRTPFDEARPFVREHPSVEDEAAPALRWLAHGPYKMKGCDEPLEIFEVGAEGLAPLAPPPDSEKARRAIRPGEEETLGWRPADGLEIPGRSGWRLVEKLGAGGFGEVWAGEQVTSRNRRAFKFCFDAQRLRALKREVSLTRLLRETLGERDDIVRIHDLRLDEPPYFLESELATEGNLLLWAEKQGGLAAIPLETRLELVAATATALAAAHSVGVLHKDIKPSNILIFKDVNGRPRPRLVDFGIGTLTDRAALVQFGDALSGLSQTTLTSVTGVSTYSPPEFTASGAFTVQGDVYALGVMLYQLVAADVSRPIGEGWQRDVKDELLREDIALCVDFEPSRRLDSAANLAVRLRSLAKRRADNEARLAEESKRLGFATLGIILMLLLVLGSVVFAMRRPIDLPDGQTAHLVVINTFSILDFITAFITAHLFLGVCHRYVQTTRLTSRGNTDLIFAFLLLQLLAFAMLVLRSENIVPEGVPANSVRAAAEDALFTTQLMYVVGALVLSTITHFTLRYTGSNQLVGWRILLLYTGAFGLSWMCKAQSFLHIRTEPIAYTSSWLCAVPFQPVSGKLVYLYGAVWVGVNVYVQWLLWPFWRIRDVNRPENSRINMVCVGIAVWGLFGVVAMVLAASGFVAAVDPNIVVQTATMIALAVGLARESSLQDRKRPDRGQRMME